MGKGEGKAGKGGKGEQRMLKSEKKDEKKAEGASAVSSARMSFSMEKLENPLGGGKVPSPPNAKGATSLPASQRSSAAKKK